MLDSRARAISSLFWSVTIILPWSDSSLLAVTSFVIVEPAICVVFFVTSSVNVAAALDEPWNR